jgi:hypothetical protein
MEIIMNVDPHKINLSERDLEDYLFENPNIVEIPLSGTPITKWISRQMRVPSGIIDLLGITTNNILVVVELKNAPFSSGHLTQVCRYARDIEEVARAAGIVNPEPYKLLIGTHDPTTELIIEANSVDVMIVTLKIDYDISIGGLWRLSESFKEKRNNEIQEISESEEFVRLSTISQAEYALFLEECKNGESPNAGQ